MTCKTVRKKRASCSTCHAKNKLFHMSCTKQAVPRVMQKNKLFHMSCKKTSCSTCHAKTMQKPCKMRRVRSANPPNPHSPRVPCYMCYMCYIYISQGKPLNIHSPRVPSAAWRGFNAGQVARPGRLLCRASGVNTSATCVESLSLEGVSQMVYILSERLLALVRPAFDLVLRRIPSLKRCVEA